jgi:protein-disulfide isomerase
LIKNSHSWEHFKYPFFRLSNNIEVFNVLNADAIELNNIPLEGIISFGNRTAEHVIFLILNPFCPHCEQEYNDIYRIYSQNQGKVKVNLVFVGDLYEKDGVANEISLLFIDLRRQLDDREFNKAVLLWFQKQDPNSIKELYEIHDVSEKSNNILNYQLDWLRKSNIKQTPVVYFDNKRLSSHYSAEQLMNFIH